ncbi:response regulator [Microbacterium rhizomatis]|uniref:Response regulator transcription factor n=1 Tax=Microbacterium rhizomatis TaxID=1631477 RepID=A0A5J5IZP5_9MICO|nr:response regulator transcription factor [Microbacterium rhizomatis]KAA9105858.1 response regulator transcription factor [Microbacterium rhizomatis]
MEGHAAAAPITVVVIDDEALVRQGLTLILQAAEDMRILGAADGREAVKLIERTRPDVVLLDIRMPEVDGLTVMRTLTDRGVDTRIVILTTFDTDEHVETALRQGAAGFLLKDTDPEQLPQYVRAAAAGGVVLVPSATNALLSSSPNPPLDPTLLAATGSLTPRETAVLRLLAAGLSNSEIGVSTHLSLGTIKDHVSAILTKLNVTTRVQAALMAERAGLLRHDSDL